MKPTFILILVSLLTFSLSAQTQKIVKKENTPTIKKKKMVDAKANTSKGKQKTIASKTEKKSTQKKKKKEDKEKTSSSKGSEKKPVVKESTPMYRPIRKNGKMITGSIYTTPGFRICIYNGSNREEAMLLKQKFIRTESKYKNYISYSRPYYKIKIGDFENKKIAAKEFKKISKEYPNAFIVPDIVTIKKIAVTR